MSTMLDFHPDMKGKLVLQDLPAVLDRAVVAEPDVKLMAYDFFQEVQPVKGL